MSLGKHQSVTSDTRATGSLHYSLHGQPKLAKQVMQSENCELEFLRQKNGQLQEKVARLVATVGDLQRNKVELLQLNQKYVRIINEYYRRPRSGKENKQNTVLQELEKDHRNLVKHCLNMQAEIKNYTQEMGRFNEMKRQLIAVNHTNTKELIEELRFLTQENKALKKENNRVSFELEKSKQECGRLKKGKEQWQEKADQQGGQLERYKSLVNTIQQQSTDKSNSYEAKIYQLQIKVEKLQSQLRKQQQYLLKVNDGRRRLQMASVQHVHQRDRLNSSLKQKRRNRSKLNHSFL